MDQLLSLDILFKWGPLGVFCFCTVIACYTLWNAYNTVQEQRLQDAKDMRDEYHKLVDQINITLDTFLRMGNKK